MVSGELVAPKKNMVETKQLALLFGLTPRRVQQLTAEGILQTEAMGKQRRYDLLASVKCYINYLRECVATKSGGSGTPEDASNESRKLKYDADIKQTKAAIAKMELEEIQGKMHRSEDVEAMTADLVFAIRGMLLALPGRLAIDLATISKPAQISMRIRTEVDAALNELSSYKYDPVAYAKRVSDREGKIFEETEDSGG